MEIVSDTTAADALRQALEAAGCSDEAMEGELQEDFEEAIDADQEQKQDEVAVIEETEDPQQQLITKVEVEESQTADTEDADILHPRPNLTWPQMIAEAIDDTNHRMATVSEIFVSIEERHPFFRGLGRHDWAEDRMVQKWHKIIRGTLRENKKFHKIAVEGARSPYWSMPDGTLKKLFSRTPNKGWITAREGVPASEPPKKLGRVDELVMCDSKVYFPQNTDYSPGPKDFHDPDPLEKKGPKGP